MPLILRFSFLDLTKLRQPFRVWPQTEEEQTRPGEKYSHSMGINRKQKGLEKPSFGSSSPEKRFLQQDRP